MIKTGKDLESELRKIVRGEVSPPARPPKAERLREEGDMLTPANRELMHLIATHNPSSVSELASLAGRAQSNVSRSLRDLAAWGLVRLIRQGALTKPELAAKSVTYDLAENKYKIVLGSIDEKPKWVLMEGGSSDTIEGSSVNQYDAESFRGLADKIKARKANSVQFHFDERASADDRIPELGQSGLRQSVNG